MITTPQTLGAYLEGQGRRIILTSKTGPAFGGDELPAPTGPRDFGLEAVARVLHIAACLRTGEQLVDFRLLGAERRARFESHARAAIAMAILDGGVQ